MDKKTIGLTADSISMLSCFTGEALRALAHGNLRIFDPDPPPSDPGGTDQDSFYPVQAHRDHCEIIFAPSGGATIFADGRWRPYAGGEAWVFSPGAHHSERAPRSGRYDLLWLTVTDQALGIYITSHRPERGYFVNEPRWAFRTTVHPHLAELQFSLQRRKLDAFRFQGLLIEALAQSVDSLERGEESPVSYQEQMIHIIKKHIESHYCEDLALEDLASIVHYSPGHLNLLFRQTTGTTIHKYLLSLRLEEAARRLKIERIPIKQIAFDLGFSDPLYFSRCFSKHFGTPPSRFARG